MVLVISNPIGKKLLGFGMAWEINTLQEKTTLRPEYFEIEQRPNQTKVWPTGWKIPKYSYHFGESLSRKIVHKISENSWDGLLSIIKIHASVTGYDSLLYLWVPPCSSVKLRNILIFAFNITNLIWLKEQEYFLAAWRSELRNHCPIHFR